MAKLSKYVFVNGRISEWGVSPRISTAVPIAASGTESKSTQWVSKSMNGLLRSRIDELKKDEKVFEKSEVKKLRTIVQNAKLGPVSGTFFKVSGPKPSGAFALGRVSRSATGRRSSMSRLVASRKR